MEKLIELLNEYERERKDCSKWDRFDLTTYEKGICLAISKSYGFIKWLVDNDKIKLQALEYTYMDLRELVKADEFVIMLLSISDSPIEDLISYLK